MKLPFRIERKNALPFLGFALREAGRFVWDRARGAPPRAAQALAYARANARPGDPDSVLAALDHFGREQAFLMNVGDRKGEILDAELRQARPARVLEIGAFCGYSAVRIARLLREWDGTLRSIEASREKLLEVGAKRLAVLQAHLERRGFLLDAWSVADAYLTTVLNWHASAGVDLARWPAVETYFERMCARPATAKAMAEERALYAEELRRR